MAHIWFTIRSIHQHRLFAGKEQSPRLVSLLSTGVVFAQSVAVASLIYS